VVLEKSLAASKDEGDADDLFFLAMCHHRLGDAARANECHERAVRWFCEERGKLPPQLMAELSELQAEAEAVLGRPMGGAKQ
jgi:hypothetical protein